MDGRAIGLAVGLGVPVVLTTEVAAAIVATVVVIFKSSPSAGLEVGAGNRPMRSDE